MVVDGVEATSYDDLDCHTACHRWNGASPRHWPWRAAGSPDSVRLPEHGGRLPAFGNDGRLCYPAERNEKWFVIVDGQEGEPFEKVGSLTLSADGKHVAYAGRIGDRWTDGCSRRVGADTAARCLALSVTGAARVRVSGGGRPDDGGRWEGPAAVQGPGPPVLSPVLRKRSPTERKRGTVGWSSWTARRSNLSRICGIRPSAPNGSMVTYAASRGGDRWAVVLNGVEGKEDREGPRPGTKIRLRRQPPVPLPVGHQGRRDPARGGDPEAPEVDRASTIRCLVPGRRRAVSDPTERDLTRCAPSGLPWSGSVRVERVGARAACVSPHGPGGPLLVWCLSEHRRTKAEAASSRASSSTQPLRCRCC